MSRFDDGSEDIGKLIVWQNLLAEDKEMAKAFFNLKEVPGLPDPDY